MKFLEEKGITNPVRALYEREDTYGIYSNRVADYLKHQYDSTIRVSEVFRINNMPVVHYTAHKEDDILTEDTETFAQEIELVSAADHETDNVWYLSAKIDPADQTDPIIYCNITVQDERCTYRLKYAEGTVGGYLYGIPESFDPADAELVIIEHIDDQYVRYGVR